MIQPTNLPSLALALPQGTARQPGGGAAFALPEEDGATTSDPTLPADDGDGSGRQDGAAGGNGLPIAAAAVDPWLIAAMGVPLATRLPTSPDATASSPPGGRMDRPSSPAPGAAVAPPILAVDAAGVPAVAASAIGGAVAASTASEAGTGHPASPRFAPAGRSGAGAAVPIEDAAGRPQEGSDVIVLPQRHRVDATSISNPHRRAAPRPIARADDGGEAVARDASIAAPKLGTIVANDPPASAPTSIGGGATATTRTKPTPEEPTLERSMPPRSPRDRATTVPVDALPAAALATSALTPLHRREIAAVAERVDRSAASGPTSLPAPSTPSAWPSGPALPAASTGSQTVQATDRTETRAGAPIDPASAPRTLAETDVAPDPDANGSPASLSLSIAATVSAGEIAIPAAIAAPAAMASPIVPTGLPLGWRLRASATPAAATISAPPPAATPLVAPVMTDTIAASTPLPRSGQPGAGAPSVLASTPAPAPTSAHVIGTEPAPTPPLRGDPRPFPSAAAAVVGDAAEHLSTGEAPPSLPATISPRSGPTMPSPPTRSAPMPSSAPTPLVAGPAARASAIVFGAARYAAQGDEGRDEPPAALGVAGAGITAPTHSAAAALPAQAALDVRHERWPTAMIERIEMIRDAVADVANAADTRIRLVPDALGTIDVDVRRDGDTLHVAFTAEQPQTRALLQDAQPRLADAAESRGLRLGQTSVGSDAGSLSQQQQQARQQPTAAFPTRAPRPTAEAKADADDTRLA